MQHLNHRALGIPVAINLLWAKTSFRPNERYSTMKFSHFRPFNETSVTRLVLKLALLQVDLLPDTRNGPSITKFDQYL